MLASVLLYTTAGSTIVADDHQVIKTARARHLPTGGIFSKFDQATSGEIESEARQLELDWVTDWLSDWLTDWLDSDADMSVEI